MNSLGCVTTRHTAKHGFAKTVATLGVSVTFVREVYVV